MESYYIYVPTDTPVTKIVRDILQEEGLLVSSAPSNQVTHVLLPVPSFDRSGNLKCHIPLPQLLSSIPEDVTVIGGNLGNLPCKKWDLLQDPDYLAQNAYITAHGALKLAANRLPMTFRDTDPLVIGWGRIGKHLSQLLKACGAKVTVAARDPQKRAMAASLGYRTCTIAQIRPNKHRLILNTVPAPVLSETNPGILKIDLASTPGMAGNDVLIAPGLPGKETPESAGKLIATTVLRYLKEAKV